MSYTNRRDLKNQICQRVLVDVFTSAHRREVSWNGDNVLYEGRIAFVRNVNVKDARCMSNGVRTRVYDGRCHGRMP